MKVKFSKQFNKQLGKLSGANQDKFWQRLDLWKISPHDPRLRLHKLEGKLRGYYSINVTGDIRALYQVIGNEVYLYQLIGTHGQLYS